MWLAGGGIKAGMTRGATDELGYNAVEAADGAAALLVLQSNIRLDLLVTDVGLPGGMNGRQVADAGRALRPGLRVLFITGYAEGAVLGQGQLEPWMHVLHKPFEIDALTNQVRQILQQGRRQNADRSSGFQDMEQRPE
jgi:CheY-like chemotaxis protein